MTTTTQDRVTATVATADIDFDTRLTLASIGIDVRLSVVGGVALEEAHDAVAVSVTEADHLTPEPAAPVFRSHPILRRAGDVIRARGWHQGSFESHTGAVCALGAIEIAAGWDLSGREQASAELQERVGSMYGPSYSIPFWNDAAGRTREEVLSLLW